MVSSRSLFCALFIALGSLVTGGHGQVDAADVPDLPGWCLTWHDEFDGVQLDTQAWDKANEKNNHNNEKQYYRAEQASIVDGKLRITATKDPLEGKQYRSARVSTNQAFSVGRFEARIDLPTSQGMWPAFWLLPRGAKWPTAGEIDIMENRGSQPTIVSSAYHWQTNPGPCCDQHQYVVQNHSAQQDGVAVDYHSGFHVYAVEWEAKQLRFFVDDKLHYTVDELPDRPIFEKPMNIILNLAVGGDFGGDPNDTTVFPQVMDVDYVRVWERAPVQSRNRYGKSQVKFAAHSDRPRSQDLLDLRGEANRDLLTQSLRADSKALPKQR
jgi:beta-glucanase (GH16 family)